MCLFAEVVTFPHFSVALMVSLRLLTSTTVTLVQAMRGRVWRDLAGDRTRDLPLGHLGGCGGLDQQETQLELHFTDVADATIH